MATAKKNPVPAKKAPAKSAVKVAVKPVAKPVVKAAAKPAAKPAAKAAAKAAAKPAVKKPVATDAALKPIKTTFNKSTLVAHVAEASGQEPKVVKAVMGALEATMLAAIHKKGAGEFSWPGVLKVTALQVAAKKARKGIDPFTKVERTFAAKPASVKVKARFFKKVKDAAL